MERSELELQHSVGGCIRRVSFLVLRKLFCGGYEIMKRGGGLQWAVVNVLFFEGNRCLPGTIWFHQYLLQLYVCQHYS